MSRPQSRHHRSVAVWWLLLPIRVGETLKGRKVCGPHVRYLVFISALLSPDITNLSESLSTVPPTCPYVKGGRVLATRAIQNTRCGKHGDVSHQVSLLWNFVCLPQGMYAVVSTDRCSFCPLTGSMSGEPARKPASAQDLQTHSVMLFLILQWGCHRHRGMPHQGKSYAKAHLSRRESAES